METKSCSKCKVIQPVSEFYKRHGKPDSSCKSCAREYLAKTKEQRSSYHKEYYSKTKEHKLERSKINYLKNRELRKKQITEWNKANRDRINYLQRERYKTNPESKIEHKHRRRARLYNNGVYEVSAKFLRNLRNSPCVMCGSTDNISVDHIVPVSRGGRHAEGNLQPLCGLCNSSKSNRTMMEWKLALQKSGGIK